MPESQDTAGSLAERIALAEKVLNHTFDDRVLLATALTHPSAIEGRDPAAYYERLEFLGDAILGFLVAEEAFRRFPDMPEGGMTRIRVAVVNRATLARVAADLGLGDAIIIGYSMKRTAGRGMKSALGNMFEALVAALYLDAGMDAARRFAQTSLGDLIVETIASRPENPKSNLQELLQARALTPTYQTVSQQGPPHDRTFTVTVTVDDEVIGEGIGRTKREAEAAAAQSALDSLHT